MVDSIMDMDLEKNSSKALSLKEKGNCEYKQKRLISSIQYYTKALFIAPCLNSVLEKTADTLRGSCDECQLRLIFTNHNLPPTNKGVTDILTVAHCYGNRSAALWELQKFEAALNDVDLAMYHGYPKEEFKMYKRKALCLSHLGRQPEALEVIQEYKKAAKHLVSSEIVEKNIATIMRDIRRIRAHNKKIEENITESFVSSSLEIKSSSDKGRCVFAKNDIPFGECVMSEYPYVSLLDKEYTYTHCSYCFIESSNVIPCYYCVFSGYCSISCMEKAWKNYHWAECTHGIKLQLYDKLTNGLLGITVRLLLTSLVDVKVLINECQKSDLNSAISLLTKQTSSDISDKYKSVLQLASSTVMIEQFNKGVDKILECYSDIFLSYFKSSFVESVKEILLLHMLQVQANVMAVVIDIPPSEERKPLVGQVWDSKTLGSGLYLFASMFNHSCDYNLTRNYTGNRLDINTCQVLAKGRELCVTYVSRARIGYTKKTERQRMIKLKRNFDCSCFICSSSSKEILHRDYGWYCLLCPKCNGLLPEPDEYSNTCEPLMAQCIDCSQLSDITPLLKVKSEILRKRETSLSDTILSYQTLSKVLYKYNNKLKEYCMKIVSCFVRKGDYRSALSYSSQICDIVEAIHGAHSMEIADALFDYCNVLKLCGEIKTSKQVASRALTLMIFHHGNDHEDTKQFREFLHMI